METIIINLKNPDPTPKLVTLFGHLLGVNPIQEAGVIYSAAEKISQYPDAQQQYIGKAAEEKRLVIGSTAEKKMNLSPFPEGFQLLEKSVNAYPVRMRSIKFYSNSEDQLLGLKLSYVKKGFTGSKQSHEIESQTAFDPRDVNPVLHLLEGKHYKKNLLTFDGYSYLQISPLLPGQSLTIQLTYEYAAKSNEVPTEAQLKDAAKKGGLASGGGSAGGSKNRRLLTRARNFWKTHGWFIVLVVLVLTVSTAIIVVKKKKSG